METKDPRSKRDILYYIGPAGVQSRERYARGLVRQLYMFGIDAKPNAKNDVITTNRTRIHIACSVNEYRGRKYHQMFSSTGCMPVAIKPIRYYDEPPFYRDSIVECVGMYEGLDIRKPTKLLLYWCGDGAKQDCNEIATELQRWMQNEGIPCRVSGSNCIRIATPKLRIHIKNDLNTLTGCVYDQIWSVRSTPENRELLMQHRRPVDRLFTRTIMDYIAEYEHF